MGHPVPKTPPVIEDTKFYKCHMADYVGTGCEQINYIRDNSCCRSGLQIKAWAGKDCTANNILCFFGGGTSELLLWLGGPYDTEDDCMFDAGPGDINYTADAFAYKIGPGDMNLLSGTKYEPFGKPRKQEYYFFGHKADNTKCWIKFDAFDWTPYFE